MIRMKERLTYAKIKPYISAVVLIGVAIYLGFSLLNSNYDYIIGDNAVTITRGKGIDIPISQITEVRYFNRLPALSNRVGESIGNKRNGTFTVANVGRGKVYATDITMPGVIIFTAETFYAITPPNAEEFTTQLQNRIK